MSGQVGGGGMLYARLAYIRVNSEYGSCCVEFDHGKVCSATHFVVQYTC